MPQRPVGTLTLATPAGENITRKNPSDGGETQPNSCLLSFPIHTFTRVPLTRGFLLFQHSQLKSNGRPVVSLPLGIQSNTEISIFMFSSQRCFLLGIIQHWIIHPQKRNKKVIITVIINVLFTNVQLQNT